MGTKIQKIKGTLDVLPSESRKWREVERCFSDVCRRFGYGEIRIPTMEYTELFVRGVGDTTDVVNKEMYTFQDRGGRSISLRPEATAGVIRAFVENGMGSLPSPQKLYYQISAFRAENVQAGRYREFHQLGIECFGANAPEADAEVLALLSLFFQELGLKGVKLHLNSIGDLESRARYREALLNYYRPLKSELCEVCQTRLEKNPLRLLDCKEPHCRELAQAAPKIADYLNETSLAHFERVQALLNAMHVDYVLDPFIVRGLDYYTKTVFEFLLEDQSGGQAGTLCGGGRYDGLVAQLGGPACSGIGFSIGEERLLMTLNAQHLLEEDDEALDLFILAVDEKGRAHAQALAMALRRLGFSLVTDLCERSFKAQMKAADRSGARYLMVLGENELQSGKGQIKALRSERAAYQGTLDVDAIAAYIRE